MLLPLFLTLLLLCLLLRPMWTLSFLLLAILWTVSIPATVVALAWFGRGKGVSLDAPKALRPLASTPSRKAELIDGGSDNPQPLHPDPRVSSAIDALLALILRDFVHKWHDPLVSAGTDDAFPTAVSATLRYALYALSQRAARLDIPHLVVFRILPLLTAHLRDYRLAALQLHKNHHGHSTPTVAAAADVLNRDDLFLAHGFRGGRLHIAVGSLSTPTSSKATEQLHLRGLVHTALLRVLPVEERTSRAVMAAVQEVVACAVLAPVVDSLTEPDFFNQILLQKAGAALEEQKMVRKLRAALDTHSSSHSGSSSSPSNSWRSTASLAEVRRLRNDLQTRLRRMAADDGQRAKLERALAVTDARIVALGGVVPSASASKHATLSTSGLAHGTGGDALTSKGSSDETESAATLARILTFPTALSHFMEYMDRRRRSPRIQFWLAVESFKAPLETLDVVPVNNDQATTGSGGTRRDRGQDGTLALREDVKRFRDGYYSNPILEVAQADKDAAKHFLEQPEPTADEVRQVRQSVLRAQQQVFDLMREEDWPPFQKTDLFHRAKEELLLFQQEQVEPRSPTESQLSRGPSGFTREQNEDTTKPSSTASDLFGSEPGGTIGRASRDTNLDFLTAIQTKPRDRPPLFSEPLFGDGDEVDEIQDALSSILADPSAAPGAAAGADGAAGSDPATDQTTRTLPQLEEQAAVVDRLRQKAELAGASEKELRVLDASREAIRLETTERAWQQPSQPQVSESTAPLSVSIPTHTVGHDADGASHALFLIQVHRGNGGWIVGRRFSEFWTLHQVLREKSAAVRALDDELPSKRLVPLMTAAFVDARRAALERYLQKLLETCDAPELTAFLTQRTPLPSTGATAAPASSTGLLTLGASMVDVVMQQLSSSSAALWPTAPPSAAQLHEAASPATGFCAPICDLLIELFELGDGNNWLRRQAIVVVLQQLLAGTIERKVNDAYATSVTPPALVSHLATAREVLWPSPSGELKPPSLPRTAKQKAQTRDAAHQLLSTLIPELAENVIGRQNARGGVRTVFAMLQNQRLTKHLVYTIIDLVFQELFPESEAEET